MSWPESRGVAIGLVGIIVLLLVNAVVSDYNTRRLVENEQWVAHSLEVLETLKEVHATTGEAEVSQRSFLITGRPAYLTVFRAASSQTEDLTRQLSTLVKDNPEQLERAAALEALIQSSLERMSETARIRQEQGVEAANARVETDDGQRIVDRVHAELRAIGATEEALLARRSKDSEHSLQVKSVTNVFGTLTGIVAVSLAFFLFQRRLRERARTESRAQTRAEREAAIGEVRQLALSEASLDALMDRASGLVAQGLDVPLVGVMERVDGDDRFLLRSGVGWNEGSVGRTFQASPDSRIVQALRGAPSGTGLVPGSDDARLREQLFDEPPLLREHGAVSGLATVIHDRPGVPFGVLCAFTTRPRAFTDDDRHFVQVAGNVLSVAVQRRRAEEALRDSEARFRSLADSVPGIVWTSLPNGECDYVNERWHAYTGLTSEQALGFGWISALHEADVEDSKKRWMHSMETGEPFECEYRFRTKEGEFRWCLGRALPARDGEGRIIKWFGNLTDIEDYKRMERALKDADRNKDQFLAMLGHELRNPLASIVNVVELLKRRARTDPSIHWETDALDRQIGALMRLVDDLLDASRISRGKIRIERGLVDLRQVVDRAVDLARPLIEENRHQLSIELPEAPLPLYADATRLVQIVSNLLTNAAKYTDPGGRIWLVAERQGTEVTIRVRDNGVGIPADMLPQVFEMFLQVDESKGRSHGGLGIGLSLVRKLAELHGGKVEARSDGPGRGSEFTVRLPLDPDAERRATAPAKAEPPAPPLRPCKILVVDDNELLAESFARLLRHEGCDARTAGDGKGAIGLAHEFEPEVVFLDVGLPDMDGYQVAESLKRDPSARNALLIAMTGYGQASDVRRARRAGFAHHMVKPVQLEEVERILREFQAEALKLRDRTGSPSS